ncbi:hypothetical protein [Sedimenticola thiotaurini]|uniref:RRM domain-containing protein n=1 Tax=Sedimenticola thiotaurini TaxID=1543721 RepID=A0A0F7JZV5_9GAMM|nr:hypothetical protein [Sedimenticola thiotaurini]AKH20123.1 hypothetical protein AAY24_06860 [Sedimenticola thiotaurini]
MKILIPHVPPTITRQALTEVIQAALKPRWYFPFHNGPAVTKCKLVRILDVDSGAIEFHGLIDIYPDDKVNKTIKRLNGTTINGFRLSVRKWIDRPQVPDGQSRLPNGQNRCKRRSHLEISIS